MENRIPVWIFVWVTVIGLLPLCFGLMGYLNPAAMFGEEATSSMAMYGGPIGLYVGRDMASVVITFFALSQRSAAMLIVALLLRISTDAFDVINNLIAGTVNAELLIFATLWISGSSFAIARLWSLRSSS